MAGYHPIVHMVDGDSPTNLLDLWHIAIDQIGKTPFFLKNRVALLINKIDGDTILETLDIFTNGLYNGYEFGN